MSTTLLDIVQDILSDADGDEINSISDTVEGDQCARVVRDTFRNIVDIHDITYHEHLKQLNASGVTTPTIMNRPAGLHSVEWVKYDKRTSVSGDPNYRYVDYLEPDDFIELCSRRTSSDSDVETMTLDSNYALLIKNDKAPEYYTFLQGYDDFIFDSYDSSLETNLQASKSLVYGTTKPTLSLTDDAVIDLPEHLMTLLRNDSRAFYFDLYKDGVTREIDKRKRMSHVRAQRKRHITKNQRPNQTGPDYGRKGR